MNGEIIYSAFPPEMTQFVRHHYRDVFENDAPAIYAASLIDNMADPNDTWSFLAMRNTQVLGGYRAHKRSKWSLQILDFAVLPMSQKDGVGRALIKHAQNLAKRANVIFLDTRVYPTSIKHGFFQVPDFSTFLMKMGFEKCEPYPPMMGEAEWLAYEKYSIARLEPAAFRMKISDKDLITRAVRYELETLTPPQRQVVLSGLHKKLDHFERSGKLSYKYEVCPICQDVGSTIENPKCNECYLRRGCKLPFIEKFRHDPQVGFIYFSQMRDYLMNLESECK